MLEKPKTVLVTGATGKSGRRVTARLTAAGAIVRAASRVGAHQFDWQKEATWAPCLKGADAAYICYAPDIALPGAVETITRFIETARSMGVERLVMLSGRGEQEAARAESVLMHSGAAWTIVRASWFMQNFSESIFSEAVSAGEVVFARGDVPEPFIDVDDVADVVAACMLNDRHVGELYEVTGPRLITFRQAVLEIETSLGNSVRYVDMEPQAYISALRRANVPDEIATLLDLLVSEVLDGRNSYVSDGVQRAIGRSPRDFATFTTQAVANGAWRLTK
ncbi:NmrA family transcriptional regulator [Tabrizicola piscis]|uniref:NmrA family transcriptional regulator n=1 Tax=Tabrizicola piscis TaxID=2494374 RepID=A0A3S8U2C4_9RHOB|nr:NAD(P)H-binding protein [Tabrizicola piscis]AZL57761.1 NmrA family transcriptional regulator [Tabrizicola piscis]